MDYDLLPVIVLFNVTWFSFFLFVAVTSGWHVFCFLYKKKKMILCVTIFYFYFLFLMVLNQRLVFFFPLPVACTFTHKLVFCCLDVFCFIL